MTLGSELGGDPLAQSVVDRWRGRKVLARRSRVVGPHGALQNLVDVEYERIVIDDQRPHRPPALPTAHVHEPPLRGERVVVCLGHDCSTSLDSAIATCWS